MFRNERAKDKRLVQLKEKRVFCTTRVLPSSISILFCVNGWCERESSKSWLILVTAVEESNLFCLSIQVVTVEGNM